MKAYNEEQLSDREALFKLFLVKKTEGEMLAARGYRLDHVMMMQSDGSLAFRQIDLSFLQDPRLGMSRGYSGPTQKYTSPAFEEFLSIRRETGLFGNRTEFSSIYFDEQSRPLVVLYLVNDPGKKVSKEHFEIVDMFLQLSVQGRTSNYEDYILITETGLNTTNASKVKNRTDGYSMEVFLDSELAFPVVKHAFAPIKAKKISRNETPAWAEEEQLEVNKLPMMLNSDAIGRWFSVKPLDVIQTEIMGTTTDTIGYARVVRQTPIKQ